MLSLLVGMILFTIKAKLIRPIKDFTPTARKKLLFLSISAILYSQLSFYKHFFSFRVMSKEKEGLSVNIVTSRKKEGSYVCLYKYSKYRYTIKYINTLLGR